MTKSFYRLRSILGFLALLSVAHTNANTDGYDYPITDRFVATVVGTPAEFEADLPASIPLRTKRLTVFPQRTTPDVVWYGRDLLYSQALQDHDAPLIFIIAGTGAAHDGSKNHIMAKAFYQAGFHVVSLSSPSLPNFVIAASSTGVIGHTTRDAADLYRVMEMIWERLQDEISVSSFSLTGYSLGGFNAAFVAQLDDTRGVFNFDRVLMINSPVSLYNSVSLLDRMTENIPGGVDNFDKFFDQLMHGISQIYTGLDDISGEDFLYKAYQALGLKDEQLAALIGTVFRLSSGSLVFTADVMTDFGYIKPKGLVLDRYSDLTRYDNISTRLNFTDYFHEFFYPYYREEYPDKTRDEFIAAVSLTSIADYLRGNDKIWVMHNADDVILEPGEIDFFREVFGDRAQIYPYGGHCGNISHRDNVAHMVSTISASRTTP